jgi:hypothetical protein
MLEKCSPVTFEETVAGAQQLELIQDSQFPVVVVDGGPPALTTPGSSGSSSHAGAAPVGIFQRMVAEASYLTKAKSLIFFSYCAEYLVTRYK